MQSEFPHSTPCLSRSCRFGKWVIESDVLRCSYNSLPCCFAAMPFPDFCGGNMAVTNWQISSAFHCMITKKAPLIIRYPWNPARAQKSKMVKHFSFFPSTIPQNMSGYKYVIVCHSMSTIIHRPPETSQVPRPHRLEWRFPEPARQIQAAENSGNDLKM